MQLVRFLTLTKVVLVLLSAWSAPAFAAIEDELLPAIEAFQYEVSADADNITVTWAVADSYYLYKSRMGFESKTNDVTLGEPSYSKGKMKEDEYFGIQEIFRNRANVIIPYSGLAAELELLIKSQGCADAGLCYPPQRWKTTVALASLRASTASSRTQQTQLIKSGAMEPLADAAPVTTPGDGNLLDIFGTSGGAQFGDSNDPLPPSEAFKASALMLDDYTLMVRWDIVPGYYLYRDKLKLEGNSDLVQLGAVNWPPGKAKFDEHFGQVQVFESSTDVTIPVSRANRNGGTLELVASYQGCAEEAGICYPPESRTLLVNIEPASSDAPTAAALTAGGGSSGALVSEQDKLATLIKEGSLPWVMLTFFGLGLLLAFTPCVLPMVPILSGIIAGQQQPMTTRKSFILSLVYVLAMALTYTIIGVIVAMLGKNVQAMFQNPAVLIGFSIVFVALALAMFDVWQFQVPVAVQNRLNRAGSGGGYLGVGIMGTLSALIVGPCVAAPLVAVLIFIGQSGDAMRGGLTLFALSMGMGTPLLVYGATAGQLMLRAGPWMELVKRLFGIMLLGVAVWLMARILSPQVVMLLWAALAVGTAWALGLFNARGIKPARAVGAAVLLYGLALGASGLAGGYDPMQLTRGTPLGEQEQHLKFDVIANLAELDARVAQAAEENKNVMLDFYADWCVECIKMEKDAFSHADVLDALKNTIVLQADVTANNDDDQALLKHFGIYGPPTIAFFDRNGEERRNYRVVGFMEAELFAEHTRDAVGQ